MNENLTYFILTRKIFDSAIWSDDPHVLKLFIYLIGTARYNKISKKFKGFEIKRGETFGLLGSNGAGKTTLVSILSTLLQPTSGYAEIYGLDISKHGNAKKIKHKIGLMLGAEMVYFRMTGIDNLKFFSRLYRIKNSSQKIKDITNNTKNVL